jgi:branched-chain amino acid transport system substrate-binding protein
MFTRNRRSLLKLFVVLAVVAFIAAACSSDDDSSDTTAAEAADTTAAAEESTETTAAAEESTETTAAAEESTETTAAAAEGGGTEVINLAVLSDCEGAFGDFHNQDLGGVGSAFAEFAGATITDPNDAAAGFTGATVAGVPVELVGVGCADDTADKAIEETRRLMEQLGADIMIGPLSGDESIAVANYAKDHPTQTFINGSAGAMDTTLEVQAPNFFRFNSDGAQWNAGTGDVAVNDLGWETAAVIMDDYSFAWTSAAGFIAEFCAAGGEVISRVFPPLNTTDYSSFVDQLPNPDEVDGYFWVVGGSGTLPALKAFEDSKGEVTSDQHMGNLFWEFAAPSFDPSLEGAYIGGFGTAGDLNLPSVAEHTEIIDAHFDSFPPFEGDAASQAHSGFLVNYYVAAKALIQALDQVGGDISDDHGALQAALADLEVEGPYGTIVLDENRQAIQDQYVRQFVLGEDGTLGLSTVAVIPSVDQTFGGTFAQGSMPSRDVPECEVRDLEWVGNATPVVDGEPQS